MVLILCVSLIAIGATWLLYTRRALSEPKLDIPHLTFDSDDSASRYKAESEKILSKGYAKYIKRGLPFSMRDSDEVNRPLVVLPIKYLEEVRWIPENRLSFWKFIDKSSILSQIGGPKITDDVALAARAGLNRALSHLIEPLHEACITAFAKEFPSCPEWTSTLPYPLIMKIFASMSALALVGPELGALDSEWQSVSMGFVEVATVAPFKVKENYPPWLYWLSKYTDSGVKTMSRYQARAGKLLAPLLQDRIKATEELKARGAKKVRGPRKYEDAVQWLLDAYTAHGKNLTPDQLAADIFVMMSAAIHSTSGAGLAILFDMLEHPEALSDIRQEIQEVKSYLPGGVWTRIALGDLRRLDSFMRESARMHSLSQYTAVQRIPTSPWTFKDGLKVPTGTTMLFPSYHRNFDPAVHPNPDLFDPTRHLRKRQDSNTHKFHFASAGEDMLNWGSGRHACPGRFFAQETLKLMMIHILEHYEFKYVEETKETPRYMPSYLFVSPNMELPILFRERKASP